MIAQINKLGTELLNKKLKYTKCLYCKHIFYPAEYACLTQFFT